MNNKLKCSALVAAIALTGCGSEMTVMKPMDKMKELTGAKVERTTFKLSVADVKTYEEVSKEADKVLSLTNISYNDPMPTKDNFPTDLKHFNTEAVKGAYSAYIAKIEMAQKAAESEYNAKLKELEAATKTAADSLATGRVAYDEAYAPIKKIKEEIAALKALEKASDERLAASITEMRETVNKVIVDQKLPVRKITRGLDSFSYWERACKQTGIEKNNYNSSYSINYKDLCISIKIPFKKDQVDAFITDESVMASIDKNLPLMVDEYLLQGALRLKTIEQDGYKQKVSALEKQKREAGIIFENTYGKSERYATRDIDNLVRQHERKKSEMERFVSGKESTISYSTRQKFNGDAEESTFRTLVHKEKNSIYKGLIKDKKVEKDVPFETFTVSPDEVNPYFLVTEKVKHDGEEVALVFGFKTTDMVDLDEKFSQDGKVMMERLQKQDFFLMDSVRYPDEERILNKALRMARNLNR